MISSLHTCTLSSFLSNKIFYYLSPTKGSQETSLFLNFCFFALLQAKRDPNDPENAMLGAVAGTTDLLKALLKYSMIL